VILATMLLFASYYGYGQQALESSFEPDKKYEIVITRMPSLSAAFFGREFAIANATAEARVETWMVDESSWLPEKNISIMEFEYVPAEKELALEAWMTQTFRLEDRLIEEDLSLEYWMLSDADWFEMN
jgi:hypothetical protein